MLRFACSLAMVICCAWSAVADIPPPPPAQGFKRVPYENVVKLSKDLPGYKFFPFQRLGLGGQETVGEELLLGTDKGIAVPSSSSPSVRTGVIAVPTKVMDELKTKENLAKLLSRDNKEKLPVGLVVHETRGTIADLKKSDPRSKVENVITVSADEKLGVKFSEKETTAPASNETAPKTSTQSQWRSIIAGLAATLGIVTLGIWCCRRK